MTMTPRLYEHALAVYRELASRAELLDNSESSDTLKFEGSKVEAFRAVGISQMYYTPIFDLLTELGCIEQTRRGASHIPTVILLHGEPELEAFESVRVGSLTKPTPLDSIRQQIDDVKRRLPQIDLDSFILSFDTRLSDLESRLEELEKQGRN